MMTVDDICKWTCVVIVSICGVIVVCATLMTQPELEPEPGPNKWAVFNSIVIGETNWSKLDPPLWHCFRVGESDVAKAYHESGVVGTFIWNSDKKDWILQDKDVR